MLSINGKISRDLSRDDTTWLRRPELKVEEVFNWQISRRWKVLVEVMYELREKRLHEVNEQEDERESAFDQKIDLWIENVGIGVVRLKAIKYNKNFFCYLSFTISLAFELFHLYSPWMPTNLVCHFPRLPVIWSTYNRAHSCDGYLIESSFRVV